MSSVDSCTPSKAIPGEQLTVSVLGSGFKEGATADFGEKVVVRDGTQFVDSTRIDASIKVHPKARLGFRDVMITNPDGSSGIGLGCFNVSP